MRRWFFGVIIALAVLGAATVTSYVILDHFYGEVQVITTQTVIIENSGQRVSIDNVQHDVACVESLENTVVLKYYDSLFPKSPDISEFREASAPLSEISVPTEAYERAQETGESVTVSNTTTTIPINAWPIATSIGIAMGVMVFAVWVGYQEMRGSATSALLEYGLHDMTVRDVEIVGHIMKLEEFTIPELMKLTKTSKITIWRTVQKLVEQKLVQPTEHTKLAANGLGGRGKPSRIYKYIGKTKT